MGVEDFDGMGVDPHRWQCEAHDRVFDPVIGIRSRKAFREFHLIQGGWRTESSLRNAMECVRILLNGGITPTEIKFFVGESS